MSAHHRHIHLLQVKPLVLQDKQSARSTHPQHTRNITMGHDGICPDVGYYHGQAHCMQDHADASSTLQPSAHVTMRRCRMLHAMAWRLVLHHTCKPVSLLTCATKVLARTTSSVVTPSNFFGLYTPAGQHHQHKLKYLDLRALLCANSPIQHPLRYCFITPSAHASTAHAALGCCYLALL